MVTFPITIPVDLKDRWVFYPPFLMMVLVMYANFYQFWANDWVGTFYSVSLANFWIDNFTLPLLYWVGLPIYFLIGEYTFIVTGFVFFTIALIFLFKTFKEDYPIILMTIFLPIFIRVESANWLMTYSRDSLIFMFACIFTYYFAKVWLKRENHYLKLLIISILAIYTKSSGLLLLWFLFVIFVRNNHNRIFNGTFLAAAIPLWRPNWAYKAWLVDLQKMVNSILDMRYFDPAFFFSNPLFYFSVGALLIMRRFTPFIIVVTSLLIGIAVHNLSPVFYDYEVVWRYSFILIPINLLVIGESLNRVIRFQAKLVSV